MATDHRWRWRWLPVVALLGLSGCEEGVDIAVDQVGGQVVVQLTPRSSSSPPCAERVIVFAGGDEAKAIWHIVRDDIDTCVSRFRFGEMPRGFVSDTVVQPPRRGVPYEIDVSGVGFNSRATFVVGDHDGRIGRS